MRLLFAGVAITLIFLSASACQSATADSDIAILSYQNLYIQMGKSSIIKTYLKNPDTEFANISVWLGGDYPASLAKFSAEAGLYLTPDQRNLTVGLNPSEERAVNLVIMSTSPKDGGYTLTVNSNTTASGTQDFDTMKIFVDYPPNFPGLEFWGIVLIIGLGVLAYWRIAK